MTTRSAHIFIFAGEPSGDLHGSHLVHAMKTKFPHLSIEGIAGPRMRAEGVQGILAMEDFSVMGFTDVIKSLPRLYKQFFQVRKQILFGQPDGVILVDYPGFNLRMAKTLRKGGYQGKIIQYISPSIWAWGPHRINEMAKTLDLLMTIYPFETKYFSNTSLKVNYVGSPVKEQISLHKYNTQWKNILSIPSSNPLVGLFPGSRRGEIERNLPIILDAAEKMKHTHPDVAFGISCSNDEIKTLIEKHLKTYPELSKSIYLIPKEFNYELMRDSRCAVAKSGTVTLELAMHKCPTIAVYKVTPINRLYAKYVVKPMISHFCIVNILAGKEVFPELIRNGLTATNLFNLLDNLYADDNARQVCITACHELDKAIGDHNASHNAASAVLELLPC